MPEWKKLLDTATTLPAESINAVLGAPQRAIASRIGNAKRNPSGIIGATSEPLLGPWAFLVPGTREQVGNEIYAMLHPNDETIENAAENAVGVDRLMSKDPRFRGKAQNFAVRTLFENATDPLNWATAGTAAAGEDLLQALGRAGTGALKSPNVAVRSTAEHFLTNVPERQGGFTPKEVSTINTIRQKGITKARVQRTIDADLLRTNARDLRKGVMPDPVRQRLLREAYVWGTPEMRQQSVELGYRPTAAEKAVSPLGLLNYELKREYDPGTGAHRPPTPMESLLLGETKTLDAPRAGFEMHQTTAQTPETLLQRVGSRLASGRSVVQHRSTAESLMKHLGIGDEMAGSVAAKTRSGGIPALQAVSRAQVDALLSTGLPHMRNVGVAGYLSLGEKGLSRAAQFLATGIPYGLSRRLEEGGASHFGIREPARYSPARILPRAVRSTTTHALDRWDNSVRAARLEQLDREQPKMTEFEKLDRVNQDIGAYNLRPRYVDLLQGIGANFPQWHSYIAPTMAARATLRHPGRVERLARAEQNANDTFLPGASYRVTMGGPTVEGASAATDLLRYIGGKYPSYFGGPSSLGPASLALHASNQPLGKRTAETAAGFVPFGGPLLDALANPYGSEAPALLRFLGGLAGVYAQDKPGQKRSHRTWRPRLDR